jgi:type II secretory pathway pseudopilin PulG
MHKYIPPEKRLKTYGLTLIEVVIAVVVVVTVLVAFMSVLTKSLQNIEFSKNKAKATKYAQEGMEWLRSERSGIGWSDFFDKICTNCINDDEVNYCLKDLSWQQKSPCNQQSAADLISGTPFFRQVSLTPVGLPSEDKVLLEMSVVWSQGGRSHDVTLTTILTKW